MTSQLAASLQEMISSVKDDIRKEPTESKHRIYLFQLLVVAGEWEKAQAQLNVCRELDAATIPMSRTYQEAINCEALRERVFAGKTTPLVFGEPREWIATLIEALRHDGDGNYQAAAQLRQQSFENAPATSGHVEWNGENTAKFDWIADADSRLGPVLEAIIDGKYYWIPFQNVSTIHLDEPTDLRDLVWTPAQFEWTNQGESVGLIPTRYVGSTSSDEDDIRMSRRTEWTENLAGEFFGTGQRMITTSVEEFALMDIRRINLQSEGPNEDS